MELKPGTATWSKNYGWWGHDPRQEPKYSTLLNGQSGKLFPKIFIFVPINRCIF